MSFRRCSCSVGSTCLLNSVPRYAAFLRANRALSPGSPHAPHRKPWSAVAYVVSREQRKPWPRPSPGPESAVSLATGTHVCRPGPDGSGVPHPPIPKRPVSGYVCGGRRVRAPKSPVESLGLGQGMTFRTSSQQGASELASGEA